MDTVREFPLGKAVIEEGSHGTSAYIILSGTAEVFKKSGRGEVPLATLGVGQVFGEMGLIEDRPRSASVRAGSDLKVRVINREHFNHLLPTKPAVLIPILKSLFERLRQASDMLADRGLQEEAGDQVSPAPEVVLEGQTREAKQILDDRKLLITKFPFLVGREALNAEADVFYNNDLTVAEEKPYVISRNHLAVAQERGRLWVVDRGSAFGTIVNGREIGGQSRVTRAPLDQERNQVILGPATSRHIFLLHVLPGDTAPT